MQKDKPRGPAAIYEELLSTLQAQVEKQDQIIRTQDETIGILTKQNEELMKIIEEFSRH